MWSIQISRYDLDIALQRSIQTVKKLLGKGKQNQINTEKYNFLFHNSDRFVDDSIIYESITKDDAPTFSSFWIFKGPLPHNKLERFSIITEPEATRRQGARRDSKQLNTQVQMLITDIAKLVKDEETIVNPDYCWNNKIICHLK